MMQHSKNKRGRCADLRSGSAARALLAVFFTSALVFFGMPGTMPAQVYADDFTYHVTVSGGLHGTVNGASQVDVDIAPGGEFNPNDYTVALNSGDDKYYFKGFHVSGIEGVLTGAQKVNEDKVFVATYGIRGDLVEYTVHYVDADGNKLRADSVFHGNPGDKPVVAYQYIDGYLPQAYNLTATLTEDGPNEFTFKYAVNENAGTDDNGAGGAQDNAGAGAGSTAGAAGTSSQTAAAGTGTAGGADGYGPAQIIDLDEEDAPQADGEQNGDDEVIPDDEPPQAEGDGLSKGAIAGIAVGALAGLGFLFWLLAFLKRRSTDNAE